MKNPIAEWRKPVNAAIKELAKKGIKGAIYHYKSGECSCCYGPERKRDFVIEGNYAPNQGCYGSAYEEHGYRISFEQDREKAVKAASALHAALEGTGWTLSWTGDLLKCMYIVKLWAKTNE